MIQRRQTLYLLTIVILGIILCFCSVLQFTTYEGEGIQRMFYFSAMGMEEVTPEMEYLDLQPVTIQGTWGLLLASALIPLLALVDIFLYKHRMAQARLDIFLAVLCLGYYAVLFMYAWFIRKQMHLDWDISFGACVPLVCFVLTLGAIRLIIHDEAMVHAADRIR